jgi:hypothetical protein
VDVDVDVEVVVEVEVVLVLVVEDDEDAVAVVDDVSCGVSSEHAAKSPATIERPNAKNIIA